jgi:hypothetical protein
MPIGVQLCKKVKVIVFVTEIVINLSTNKLLNWIFIVRIIYYLDRPYLFYLFLHLFFSSLLFLFKALELLFGCK